MAEVVSAADLKDFCQRLETLLQQSESILNQASQVCGLTSLKVLLANVLYGLLFTRAAEVQIRL